MLANTHVTNIRIYYSKLELRLNQLKVLQALFWIQRYCCVKLCLFLICPVFMVARSQSKMRALKSQRSCLTHSQVSGF